MPLFRAIPPSSKSMASGRNGGKEGAAEASDMGKGNRYDMGKGWHLVPKQPSLPPPLQAEAHQREATKERMTQIAVSKGKGTAGASRVSTTSGQSRCLRSVRRRRAPKAVMPLMPLMVLMPLRDTTLRRRSPRPLVHLCGHRVHR